MSKQRFAMPVTVHLFMIQEGKVLLLRRYQTGYEDGNYSVVAGHLDGGEEVKTAAIREAREEAGITIDPKDLSVIGVMHRNAGGVERIDFFLEVRRWSGALRNAEPDKCDELVWYDLDQLPPNVIPYVLRALQNYRSGVWFDSFGWTSPTRVV